MYNCSNFGSSHQWGQQLLLKGLPKDVAHSLSSVRPEIPPAGKQRVGIEPQKKAVGGATSKVPLRAPTPVVKVGLDVLPKA